MLTTLILLVQNLRADKKAVTALEYGLIAALVAVVIITAVTALGTNLSKTFTTVANSL
jgi:pilus assembly protein Flp/PilA